MEEARPLREKAAELSAQARRIKAEFREKRKAKSVSQVQLAALDEKLKQTERDARESQAKGDSIENAAYDLKAVNPNRVTKEDKRTPMQLLEFITAKGREADAALDRLQKLVGR